MNRRRIVYAVDTTTGTYQVPATSVAHAIARFRLDHRGSRVLGVRELPELPAPTPAKAD